MDRRIVVIDVLVLALTAVSILFLIGYARPLVIAPIDSLETSNNSVLFDFEKGSAVLIDDNEEFTSPERFSVEEGPVITLEPGTYYWKVEGVIDSEIRELTILSVIDLKIRESDSEGRYEVVNAGNVELDVEIYDKGSLVGNVVLGVEERENVSGNKFIGRENE